MSTAKLQTFCLSLNMTSQPIRKMFHVLTSSLNILRITKRVIATNLSTTNQYVIGRFVWNLQFVYKSQIKYWPKICRQMFNDFVFFQRNCSSDSQCGKDVSCDNGKCDASRDIRMVRETKCRCNFVSNQNAQCYVVFCLVVASHH